MTWLLVTLSYQKCTAMTMLSDHIIGEYILTTFNYVVIRKIALKKK